MFNLLVRGSGWSGNRDTMILSRVFEYTDQEIGGRYSNSQDPNFSALMSLPSIFMEESSQNEQEVARVGTIIKAKAVGSEVRLQYIYDPDIPPITNQRLRALATDLEIEDFEFSRTHWAVKDVDLFRVLLSHLEPRRQTPRVFQISDPEIIEPSLVSVMMPFDASFDAVYSVISGAADAAGFRSRRADEIWENPAVIQDVVSLIDKGAIVVCDCTGRNPNVFYEIGIAHTLGREVILLTQSETDVPFDLRHLRYVKYLNNGEGLEKLAEDLRERFGDLSAN